jgi:hypothetical protein
VLAAVRWATECGRRGSGLRVRRFRRCGKSEQSWRNAVAHNILA